MTHGIDKQTWIAGQHRVDLYRIECSSCGFETVRTTGDSMREVINHFYDKGWRAYLLEEGAYWWCPHCIEIHGYTKNPLSAFQVESQGV